MYIEYILFHFLNKNNIMKIGSKIKFYYLFS